MEMDVREFADEYFGRATTEFNGVISQTMRQHFGNRWMNGWKKTDTQMLQLCQQFMPDSFYFRVVGSAQGKPIHTTREEIQGEFDITIGFNVQDLDPELVDKKLGLIERALQMDAVGTVDRTEALAATFELIDPNLGERLLKPAEAASQQEVEDKQTVFVKLMAGIPVDIKAGQAYELRMRVLHNLFNQNQEAQRLYQSNPQAKAAMENRMKQLSQQVVQRQNAITGRLGAPSATMMQSQ